MTESRAATCELCIGELGTVPITMTDRGEGRPVLVLHGGGGPGTVAPWADRLTAARPARVITPTHPGFGGTVRPESLATISGLAALYASLLDHLDLDGVTVVGNSIGGWIAAEMALLALPRVTGFVLVDAVGIEVPDHPVVDFFGLTPGEVAQRSYHDPERFGIDPMKLSATALAAMAGNRHALGVYAGTDMADPALRDRLAKVTAPTLVLWGEADRIADVDYGRAFAAAIPSAEFRILPGTGHLPQVETPQELLDVVWTFIDTRRAVPTR